MPQSLSKRDFVRRIQVRSNRYRVEFTETNLNEWMKQALAFSADRLPNTGRKPVYIYGCRHYRRALQLVRLRAGGITDRDEIVLQIFLRGYGAAAHDVRSALEKEFLRAQAKLNLSLRSIYADRSDEIPPKRKQQLLEQLGNLDQRFANANIQLQDDLLIEAVRGARGGKSAAASQSEFLTIVLPLIRGILEVSREDESEWLRMIRQSSDAHYEGARENFNFIRSILEVSEHYGNSVAWKDAFQLAGKAILSREMAAFMFSVALKLARESIEIGRFFAGNQLESGDGLLGQQSG